MVAAVGTSTVAPMYPYRTEWTGTSGSPHRVFAIATLYSCNAQRLGPTVEANQLSDEAVARASTDRDR